MLLPQGAFAEFGIFKMFFLDALVSFLSQSVNFYNSEG